MVKGHRLQQMLEIEIGVNLGVVALRFNPIILKLYMGLYEVLFFYHYLVLKDTGLYECLLCLRSRLHGWKLYSG